MENYICKPGYEKQLYNGFIIVTNEQEKRCMIIEPFGNSKYKKRREVMGPYSGHGDGYGNKLYTRIPISDLVVKAKNFIDNHIVKWADSPNNHKNKNL